MGLTDLGDVAQAKWFNRQDAVIQYHITCGMISKEHVIEGLLSLAYAVWSAEIVKHAYGDTVTMKCMFARGSHMTWNPKLKFDASKLKVDFASIIQTESFCSL